MNPLTQAILKTGIIDPNMFREMKRFGAPIEEGVPDVVPPRTPEEVASLIEEALQSEGLVITRETDLEVLRDYTETNRRGTLHLELDVAKELQEVDSKSNIEVSFGQTKMGEYIIPWFGESIAEMMTNGLTFLTDPDVKVENGPEDKNVYFDNVRELFFGNVKAFMVCRPVRRG